MYWLKRRWWGLTITYVLLLGLYYGGIWALIEPLELPESWDILPTFLRSRLFFHLLGSVILAAHTSLLFELFPPVQVI